MSRRDLIDPEVREPLDHVAGHPGQHGSATEKNGRPAGCERRPGGTRSSRRGREVRSS